MTDLEYNLIHRFNVGDALRRSAARTPQQRAIHFMGRELTYAELDALANRMARKLMAAGVGARRFGGDLCHELAGICGGVLWLRPDRRGAGSHQPDVYR